VDVEVNSGAHVRRANLSLSFDDGAVTPLVTKTPRRQKTFFAEIVLDTPELSGIIF
jgi:hypothetical protein